MRLYIMFIGDFEKPLLVSAAVKGCKRFLDRVWNMTLSFQIPGILVKRDFLHKTIKVTNDIENSSSIRRSPRSCPS